MQTLSSQSQLLGCSQMTQVDLKVFKELSQTHSNLCVSERNEDWKVMESDSRQIASAHSSPSGETGEDRSPTLMFGRRRRRAQLCVCACVGVCVQWEERQSHRHPHTHSHIHISLYFYQMRTLYGLPFILVTAFIPNKDIFSNTNLYLHIPNPDLR